MVQILVIYPWVHYNRSSFHRTTRQKLPFTHAIKTCHVWITTALSTTTHPTMTEENDSVRLQCLSQPCVYVQQSSATHTRGASPPIVTQLNLSVESSHVYTCSSLRVDAMCACAIPVECPARVTGCVAAEKKCGQQGTLVEFGVILLLDDEAH